MNNYLLYAGVLFFTAHLTAMEKSPAAHGELINVIESGNQTRALELISQGIQVNAQDIDGWTALMRAARRGYVEITKVLIAAGAHVNAQDAYGCTALTDGAHNGHAEIVKILIAAGADVSSQTDHGCTALICAALNGHTEIVKMLIIASAHSNVTINARATNGWTAFVYAAYYEHQEVAKVLIAAGAHLYTTLLEKNWLDCDKYEAFENSIQKLFACARSLSSEWDDPSAKSTPPRERLHTLNALIKERELRLDYIDPQGNTLLHYVVLSGDRAAISLVLYFMVKHNQLDTLEHYDKQLDMTPIEMAVIKGGAPLLYPFFNLRLLKKN